MAIVPATTVVTNTPAPEKQQKITLFHLMDFPKYVDTISMG